MAIAHEIGALLEVRGAQWRLTGAVRHESCTVLTLESDDNARLRVIEPFDRPRPVASASLIRRSRRAVLRSALAAIVETRSAAGLWTAGSASMQLWPYQLEPALAAIAGAARLLLADEVGLGKTIQAGLLLAELFARGWIERALIVCPAGLRDTWSRELATRFKLHAAVIDQHVMAERIAELPPGVNPWAGDAITIASIDFIKRPEVMAAVLSAPIDLLIADEAHHLSPGTDRGNAVSRLAARSPWCVFVSATPHSGDDAAFAYLTNLGSHGEPITTFRRGRGDVGVPSGRRTHLLAITPTEDESRLFAALDRYTRAICRERGREVRAVRLIATTLLRRAASSAAAIEHTLARRRDLLSLSGPAPAQPLLPWDDEDDADRIEADGLLATPGMDDADAETIALTRLIELSRRCDGRSKLRRLSRLIDRLREPVVVFTEYRDTLESVCAALRGHRRVGAIHGGVAADLRRAVVDAFNGGRLDVLVATDAAGEGLNLHHRCRLVVDIELPWNPLRLEQRVGRVDRIGQKKVVHAIRLFHSRSIEQRVLEHLRLRDRRAAAAFGLTGVDEAAIAAAVFDEEPVKARGPLLLAGAHVAAAEGEAARLEGQRRARALGAATTGGITWAAARSAHRYDVVLLCRCSYLNPKGNAIADQLKVHCIRIAARNRREQRLAIQAARHHLTRTVPPPEASGLSTLESCRDRIERRIHAIRKALCSERIEQQASMFDHRAGDLAAARLVAEQRISEALARVASSIALPSTDCARIEIVAAWPERRR
jgi:superfamily II DNA or RNA helicase